jgi:DNA-binding MarR family transcriptional regulator
MDHELLGDLNDADMRIFQNKARLGIMTLLITMGPSDFSSLKSQLKITDGNLGAHLRVLEEAGYLKAEKSFVGRKPRTGCRITDKGREAFLNYLKQLETVIKMVDPEKP